MSAFIATGLVKFAGIAATTLAVVLLLSFPLQAVRFSDGSVAFDQPPQFLEATTPYVDVNYPYPTYYVRLQVPANAGEPLGRVDLVQQPNQEVLQFIPKATLAYQGNSRRNRLSLGNVSTDNRGQTLSINFNPPVPPGTVVTLEVSPYSNPRFDGVYLFSVIAYPAGEKAQGLQIGTGRLQFYRDGDGSD